MSENYDVHRLPAVAASATREAANGDLLVDRVSRTSGIEVEVIRGEEAARLLHSALAHSMDISHANQVTDAILKETQSGWRLKLQGKSGLMLENRTLDKRILPFQDAFDADLELDR